MSTNRDKPTIQELKAGWSKAGYPTTREFAERLREAVLDGGFKESPVGDLIRAQLRRSPLQKPG